MNSRLYVAYAPFIVLGTIEAASIPVVGFNAVLMSEHFGSFLAFGVLHAAMGMQYIKVIVLWCILRCCCCCGRLLLPLLLLPLLCSTNLTHPWHRLHLTQLCHVSGES